jgi:ribosome-associated toxin RatA of RatAB toxin-antitoxin module
MNQYHRTIDVDAPAAYVFEFVSTIENLPRYLPTVHGSNTQPGERVKIFGEVGGEPYQNDGRFHVDPQSRRMEWSSDGENRYSGWLTVSEGNERCEVTVHLDYEPSRHQAERMQAQMGSVDHAIGHSMERALLSIKEICEQEATGQPAKPTRQGESYMG